jgi:hypothetical protein
VTVKTIKRGAELEGEVHVTVRVYERNKYARIDWDFFGLPEENDDYFKENEKEISEMVKEIYFSVAIKTSEFYGNGLTGYMDGVPIEVAHRAAGEVSDLFDRYARRRAQSM